MIKFLSLPNPLFDRMRMHAHSRGVSVMSTMVLSIAWFSLIKALISAAYIFMQYYHG